MRRVILIVMDSVGIGELPDAVQYGDQGSNTLGNIARQVSGFRLPHMERLGLGHIDGIQHFEKLDSLTGCYGRMMEVSAGKDTTTGHWEMTGIILEKAFPVYPHGFPSEIMNEFEKRVGTKTLGNVVASGTEIIKALGQQHVITGYPIIYTSADSVFQIAAHEEVCPIERLYEMCKIARDILVNDHAVGRVIARPFAGSEGNFFRTNRRKDFSLKPIRKTILEHAVDQGMKVKAVGKIEDIFGGQGITDAIHTHDNMEGVQATIAYIQESFEGIIFTNLVDFDMLYGHRNDVAGYAGALVDFDQRIPEILESMKQEDLLIITADHGCDPTTKSTDHSREYVPLLVYGKAIQKDVQLGTRKTFADIAATISQYLNLCYKEPGTSFLKMITP